MLSQIGSSYYTQQLQIRGGDQSRMSLSYENFLATNFKEDNTDAGLVLSEYYQMIQNWTFKKNTLPHLLILSCREYVC